MKIGIILITLFALACARPQIHIPDKCEDVLAVKVCNNLEELAIRLKLNAEDVKQAVIAAAKDGKANAEEIYAAAKDILMKQVLSKKCEDLTTVENCKKLRKVAGVLKIQAEVLQEYLVKAIAAGASTAQDVYAQVLQFYKDEIKTKNCEDFLQKSQCDTLRKIALKLKIKADDFENAVREAYLKALVDGKSMFDEAIKTFKDYAMNTKCEDLLNPDLCAALRRYAQITKVQFPVLMETAVDLLIKGYDVGKDLLKGIYNIVDHFYDCEDVFDKPSCDKLIWLADKIGDGAAIVEAFIKKNVPIAIEKGKDFVNNLPQIFSEVYNFLKEKVWCKLNPWCKSSDDVMFSDEFQDEDMLQRWNEIKAKLRNYLDTKFPGLEDNVKEKVKELLERATSIKSLFQEAALEVFKNFKDTGKKVFDVVKALIRNVISGKNDEIEDEDFSQVFQQWKEKVKNYIDTHYPELEDQVKQKVKEVIDRLNSIYDLFLGANEEIKQILKETTVNVNQILTDLWKNVGKSDEMEDEDIKDKLNEWRQKIKDYIDARYPDLEDKLKEKINNIIERANSKYTLLKAAVKEFFGNLGEYRSKFVQIMRDLKDKYFPSQDEEMYDEDINEVFQQWKEKAKNYIDTHYPELKDQVKQKFKEMIDRASSLQTLIFDAYNELKGKAMKILSDLIKGIRQSDEMEDEDIKDKLNEWRQKIKDYIDARYPGLEDKLKEKINNIIDRANNKYSLVKEAVKEFFGNLGEYREKFFQIVKDLKEKYFPSQEDEMYDEDIVDTVKEFRQKLKDYVDKRFPDLEDKIRQHVKNVIERARNILDLGFEAMKEARQMFLESGKKVFEVVRALSKDILAGKVM